MPYTVFMTKGSYLKEHSETAQKFTNAIYKAQRWVEKNDPETITNSIMPYFKDADHDIVVNAIKRYKEQGSYATDPILDEAEWNNLLDVLRTAGELKQEVQRDLIVDNSLAEKAKADVQ